MLNVGEYGLLLAINTNYNMSGFTALELTITRPNGSTLVRTNGDVLVPSVALVTDNMGTFAASEYVTYRFQAGDLTASGEYLVRLSYTDGSKHLVGDAASFTVSP